MALDQGRVRQRFERGVDWALAHVHELAPDARFAVLAGLLLADPQKAETYRSRLWHDQKVKLSGIGKVLDALTLGLLRRSFQEKRDRTNVFFACIERDPSPLVRTDLDSFRHIPDSVPRSLEELHTTDREHSNAALLQASLGRVEAPILAWMRREDFWGYNLSHQLLAWVVCHKVGQNKEEARERVGRLAWRLFHEIRQGPRNVLYDLFAERIAFLLLAGFPPERLEGEIGQILEIHDPGDGGWWFTRVPADLTLLLENGYLGASPRSQAEPVADLRSLEILHRGHSTGLSLWALGLWLNSAHPESSGSERVRG